MTGRSEDIPRDAPEVRITNPNPLPGHTGIIAAPDADTRAFRADNLAGDGWPTDVTWVLLTPSFRPGMPFDLASYPPEWVTEVTP